MSTFVDIPADALRKRLLSIGSLVEEDGGSFKCHVVGREEVFDLVPPAARAMVRVYTSVANGASSARACGEDAVRIVVCVGTPEGVRPLEEGTTVHRTAPRGLPEEKRVEAFLERFVGVLRAAFRRAGDVPTCPACGRAMARRKSRHGEFFGCSGFPVCRSTRAA